MVVDRTLQRGRLMRMRPVAMIVAMVMIVPATVSVRLRRLVSVGEEASAVTVRNPRQILDGMHPAVPQERNRSIGGEQQRTSDSIGTSHQPFNLGTSRAP